MLPGLAPTLTQFLNCALADVLLTRDELGGLMANLLVSGEPVRGTTKLSEWVVRHADRLGTRYTSELARHYR